jgi:hypothetical protein
MTAAKVASHLRDLVWIKQPEAVRLRAHTTQRLEIRAALKHARTAFAHARRIDDGALRAALGAMALRNLLDAVANAAGSNDASPERKLEEARSRVQACLTSPALERALEEFTDPKRDPPTDTGAFAALLELATFIELLVDTRPTREVQLRRVLWGVAIGAALLCLLWGVLKPKNVASGKAVASSSVCRRIPPPRYREARLARLVDGVIAEASFGVCTAVEHNPWITVDLAKQHRITSVVVYSRSDCCWGSTDIPLQLQLSNDNREFVTVATRTKPFTDELPWRVAVAGRSARYVRLYSPANEPRDIVVNELEIYER